MANPTNTFFDASAWAHRLQDGDPIADAAPPAFTAVRDLEIASLNVTLAELAYRDAGAPLQDEQGDAEQVRAFAKACEEYAAALAALAEARRRELDTR